MLAKTVPVATSATPDAAETASAVKARREGKAAAKVPSATVVTYEESKETLADAAAPPKGKSLPEL